MNVAITLAGMVAISTDGRQVQLYDRRARIAFARLVVDGEGGTTADRLADVIWPTNPPATWKSALRTVLARVRSFVTSAVPDGSCRLVLREGRYVLQLPPGTSVDVDRAEFDVDAAQGALQSGDAAAAGTLCVSALNNLRLPVLADYDSDWIEALRDRRVELTVVALETLSSVASQLGKSAAALAAACEAMSLAPLRESAHRCRMLAYARSGNSAEALRTYERLRRLLAEELGANPDPETERLYMELLAH